MRSDVVERRWCLLTGTWSLVFAAPHVYWALGGRAGLGAQAAAADAALRETWFAAYNLAAVGLAGFGALAAGVVALGRVRARSRRWLRAAAGTAGVVLLVRGALGLVLLGAGMVRGTDASATPTVLLAIEYWFVAGGVVHVGMARSLRVAGSVRDDEM